MLDLQEHRPSNSPDTADNAFSGEAPLPDVCQSVSASASSSVCRICQLGRTETDKQLVDIGCQCKGTMARCHTECLVDWANAQQSAVCEICQTEYPRVEGQPVSRTRLSPRRSLRDFLGDRWNNRRLWFTGISILLTLCTIVSGVLVHYVETDYMKNFHPKSFTRTRLIRANYNFSFGITLSLFIFCFVLFLVVLILWLISECLFWPQARMVLRAQRFQVVPADPTTFVMRSSRSHLTETTTSQDHTRNNRMRTTSL